MSDSLVAYDPVSPHEGQQSLKFHRPTRETSALHATSTLMRLEPNHRYEYRAWLRQDIEEFAPENYGSGATTYVRDRTGGGNEPLVIIGTDKEPHLDWTLTSRRTFRTGSEALDVVVHVQALKHQGDFWVDDVALLDLGPLPPLPESNNLVPNSSFELSRLKDWPDRWGPTQLVAWEDGKFVGDPDSPFRMDTENPYHGTYSLRWDGRGKGGMLAEFRTMPYSRDRDGIEVIEGETYVVSLYMRAAEEGTTVTVTANNIGSGEFTVGTTWERYSFSAVKQEGFPSGRTGISINCKKVVWVDAVQLEKGSAPTEYEDDGYEPSYPDEDEYLRPTPPRRLRINKKGP